MKKFKLKQLIDNDNFENKEVDSGIIKFEYEENQFATILITEEDDALYPGIYDENEYKFLKENFGEDRCEEIKIEALSQAVRTEWLEPTPEQIDLGHTGLIFLYDADSDPWLGDVHNL
ncbi:MAG: hypothetical protein AABY22_25650 [Nanoarchaeota archaeon]|mgnify:CR=1 FL=1